MVFSFSEPLGLEESNLLSVNGKAIVSKVLLYPCPPWLESWWRCLELMLSTCSLALTALLVEHEWEKGQGPRTQNHLWSYSKVSFNYHFKNLRREKIRNLVILLQWKPFIFSEESDKLGPNLWHSSFGIQPNSWICLYFSKTAVCQIGYGIP